jgi:glycosyltransferase involved in cell wall biosynthesis
LFLLPSEKESFGLSALEAMVNRVAVISTNTGGLPEVNKHGISGYLSNVGDVEDMAKNAIKILENEETLELFKDNAKKVAAKFDIENVVPFYEAIYEKALEVKV